MEDTGTTFTVSVVTGRTARVAVQDGSVILRLRGAPPVAVGAGADLDAGAPAASRGRAAGLARRFHADADADADAVAGTGDVTGTPGGATSHGDGPTGWRAGRGNSGTQFRTAVAALAAGAHREAAAAFARFLLEPPADPRAEDAAYLRENIALERCGAAEETRRAAQAYLQLYPRGSAVPRSKVVAFTQTPRTESVP